MTTLAKTGLDAPVHTHAELSAYLAGGARPPDRWGIGAESEKLVIDVHTGEAAHFERIEQLLLRLEEHSPWQGIREEGRLIALQGPASSITLEPGGQLELSGELCPDIHCSYGDFVSHHRAVSAEAAHLGLAFLGFGVQPFTPLEQISWVPKNRYRVMGPYMLRTGDLGQAMMKQSAGLQVNIDFADEEDWLAKLRLALLLSPILFALFANSPLRDGRPSGFLSTRGEIWSRTDPDRTGLLPQMFQEGAGYATYVDYALDVPMYFILRQGRYIDLTRERYTFRRYLREGFQGERATLADWDLHLSTLFPEARLRPQIELRSADSLPPRMTMAVAALVKGLMYDRTALAGARELLERELIPELGRIFPESWRLGLKTRVGRRTLREVSLDLIALAETGLAQQATLNERGLDETIYLAEARDIARSGETLAERLLARWQGDRRRKVGVLLDHCGFSPDLTAP